MTPFLYLTVHKAASTFISTQLLQPLAEDLGLPRQDPDLDAKRMGRSKWSVQFDNYAAVPSLLGPVRSPDRLTTEALFDDWRKVMVLRDPRDVLTSFYFYAVRIIGPQEPIDEAVTLWTGMFVDRFEDYRVRFAPRPNLLLLRYEDMLADWPAFCRSMGKFAGASKQWRRSARDLKSEIEPVSENPRSHKRQVGAGDHARKLKSSTIRQLNEAFGPVLDWLEYPTVVEDAT